MWISIFSYPQYFKFLCVIIIILMLKNLHKIVIKVINMEYTEKLEEIEKVIEYLNKEKFYNSLANRVYYFCYQCMIMFLNDIYSDKREYIKNNWSTHEDTINAYIQNKFYGPNSQKDKQNFSKNINKLKRLRKKADYKVYESISNDEASDIINGFNVIKNIV